jgi:hypothetical protein
MSEPRYLIDEEGRAPLFQGSFVSHGKWFRGPCVGSSAREIPCEPVHTIGRGGQSLESLGRDGIDAPHPKETAPARGWLRWGRSDGEECRISAQF